MANHSGESGPFKKGSKVRVTVVKAQNKPEGPAGADDYTEALAAILRQRDVFRFRNFLASSGRALPDEMMLDTLKMETLLHQLTLTMPGLADLHEASRQWLDHNTWLGQNPSLNEAARREPGVRPDVPGLPQSVQGRRTIYLKIAPPSARPDRN